MYLRFSLPVFSQLSLDEQKCMANILKSAGLSLTTSRINLLHYLDRTNLPSTALELSRQVNIPLSTTHRNLSVLAHAGLAEYFIDRSGTSRWFLVAAGKPAFCPCCNQEYAAFVDRQNCAGIKHLLNIKTDDNLMGNHSVC